MKKILNITLALLLGITAFAQQALWGGQNIISPEVNPDNTVTFRFQAPKAITVQLTGEFLPTQKMDTPYGVFDMPGVTDLKEGKDGLWEYTTTEPVKSNLYGYSFIVDGLRTTDPNNVYMIRDVASVTNVFIVGGGLGDFYSVKDVPHGSVTRRWYNSPGLNAERRITIYTPPGYETSKQTYPVFYLLHGAGGDEEAWINLGRSSQILDNLIAQGKAKPMIVVMTNGHTFNQAAPGESSKGLYKPTMSIGSITGGDMESSFIDIIKFVESNYRVKKDKASRAIAGLSMGGFHSQYISAYYPNTFDYIGLFSGAGLFPTLSPNSQEEIPDVYKNFDKKLETQKKNGYKLYWIACGNTDFVLQGVTDFRKKLDDVDMKYIYRESEGGHTWSNWRMYLTEFVPMLFK